VDRTDAGVLPAQQAVLLDRIAAYRGASSLASMDLTAPWERVTEPAVTVERVPARQSVPEVQPKAYPQILAGVPGPDSELSPAVSSAGAASAAVLAAEVPRTRTEVRAEYVPEPDDDSPPPPGEDTLTARARNDYLHLLVDDRVPSIRDLRSRYSIGQDRATRIQNELKRYLP
jgi:hypothetical protein